MSVDRWKDTEVLVSNMYTMEYYSATKIRMHLNEVDEPRAYCAEWSKSERERQILYINAYIYMYIYIYIYIWNLEGWYWWIYLQGSNGGADIENRLMDIVGEGEGGTYGERDMETYTL